MKVIAGARIQSGVMTMKQKSSFLADIKNLRDGDYVVTVERKKKTRSIEQNRYYWGVVVPLVRQGLIDLGYQITFEGTHEYLKANFNVIEIINEHSGEIIKTVGSTTEMSTSQMMEYFAQIYRWSAEYLNVIIPEPNTQLTICP